MSAATETPPSTATTTAKPVALIGNYSCANRGDAAILRGLLAELDQTFEIPYSIFSEMPDVAALVLERRVKHAPLPTHSMRRLARLAQSIGAGNKPLRRLAFSRKRFDAARRVLLEHQSIVFVGGSYFVDLYGESKYQLPLLATTLAKPYALCGHSLGPFESRQVKTLARALLDGAAAVALRDETSLEHVQSTGCSMERIKVMADTAWLLPEAGEQARRRAAVIVPDDAPVIAVTVRTLAPFDKRLGITQETFESQIAAGLDLVIAMGYRVLFISMCTGLGGYRLDDRIVAHHVKARMTRLDRAAVLMDELSDLETVAVLQRCAALVGTRMHSTILSMIAGTPALAVPYEHKSVGLFRKMGFNDRVLELATLDPRELAHRVRTLVESGAAAREATLSSALRERKSAAAGVAWILEKLGLGGSMAGPTGGATAPRRIPPTAGAIN